MRLGILKQLGLLVLNLEAIHKPASPPNMYHGIINEVSSGVPPQPVDRWHVISCSGMHRCTVQWGYTSLEHMLWWCVQQTHRQTDWT